MAKNEDSLAYVELMLGYLLFSHPMFFRQHGLNQLNKKPYLCEYYLKINLTELHLKVECTPI